MSYGLLLLRLVAGGTMFGHGAQKLLGWFGGGGVSGTAGFFGNMGFRPALPAALAAGLAEAGGLLLAVGFLTPLAALGIATVMATAIAAVHWSKGFWNTNGGYEFPLLMFSAAVALAATGPGRFSIDRAIGWDNNISGVWWGVGVAAAAVALTFLTITLARKSERLRTSTA